MGRHVSRQRRRVVSCRGWVRRSVWGSLSRAAVLQRSKASWQHAARTSLDPRLPSCACTLSRPVHTASQVFLLRGNHELRATNSNVSRYGSVCLHCLWHEDLGTWERRRPSLWWARVGCSSPAGICCVPGPPMPLHREPPSTNPLT